MSLIARILPYAQIVLSVILVTAILLQQTEAALGNAFGGDDSSGFHHTRRGFEKFLFYLTIICGVLFVLLAFLSIIVRR